MNNTKMSLINSEKHFLELLLQTNPKQRKLLLSSLTNQQLRVLGEIAANVLHSVILLNEKEKGKLKKHKSLLLVIGDKNTSRKLKLQKLTRNQKGVSTLLRVVKPFLKKWWT